MIMTCARLKTLSGCMQARVTRWSCVCGARSFSASSSRTAWHSAAGGPAARPGAAAAADTAFCPVPAELPGALDTLDAMLDGSRSAFETFLRIPLPARRRNIELDWKDYDDLGYLSGHSVGEAEGAMFDALVQTHASLDIR